MLFSSLLLSLLAAFACAGPVSRSAPAKKHVAAHVIVGNCYPYTVENWLSDIDLAYASGIDAFALNVGSDSWEPLQVAYAYQAAQQSGTGFKLFMSFDMSSLPCGSPNDAATLRSYITTYAAHPNQLTYDGRVFASTFSGESCTFGQSSVQSGWSTQFVQQLSGPNAVYFVPSFSVAPSSFGTFKGVIDGMFAWNSAWPIDITTNSVANNGLSEIGTTQMDQDYIDALSSMDGTYMGAVSPWFSTHYGSQSYDKNFIYLCDEHLYVKRWQNLVELRDQVDILEMISWNDFGESTYVGPIEGDQPGSQQWVDGFDHTAWLEITLYFATAFKTGTYPCITEDRIYMWSRPHPALAFAPDSVGPPRNHEITQDKVWAVIFATSPATVTLSTSSTESLTSNVPAGVTNLLIDIAAGGYMKAVLERSGETVIDLEPEFVFNPNPSSYNFNALVVSS